jgi:hypothetical protein
MRETSHDDTDSSRLLAHYHRTNDAFGFEFGCLDRYDLDPNNFAFHSPQQIQSEFDADIAELAKPFVPIAVTQQARYYGNSRLANAFVSRVAYRIGDPRPW